MKNPVRSRKVHEDFVLRSRQGTWGHPLSMLLALSTTGLFQRAPHVMWGAFAFLTLVAGLRLLLIRRWDDLYDRDPVLWDRMHVGLIVMCAIVWGVVPGVAITTYGYYDQATLALLVYHAAISFGMVNSMVHDWPTMVAILGILFVPLVVTQLWSGGSFRWGPALAFIVYPLYLASQGKKLHTMYSQQVSDHLELAIIAHHDSLTGLPNRLFLNELLEKSLLIARENSREVALLYIDLDGFKQINDRHSHRVGDLFLREVARRLRDASGDKGVAARIGGDEFTILLSDFASTRDVLRTAQRVLESAREPLFIEGNRLTYSASIGISLFPLNAAEADHLMSTADQAMYTAKTSGKNRICFFPEQPLLTGPKLPSEPLNVQNAANDIRNLVLAGSSPTPDE